ncbi:hypothetical protein SODALDRAFT_332512, partial [Sodiomyces alkalinus F11]
MPTSVIISLAIIGITAAADAAAVELTVIDTALIVVPTIRRRGFTSTSHGPHYKRDFASTLHCSALLFDQSNQFEGIELI